jgi:hypothetical protein
MAAACDSDRRGRPCALASAVRTAARVAREGVLGCRARRGAEAADPQPRRARARAHRREPEVLRLAADGIWGPDTARGGL